MSSNQKIADKIKHLKKEKNAVILTHNYQIPEVQDIADYVGDSYGLSLQASKTSADIIVFCGVYFMAETAKILSPSKTVLIPDKTSGCPMADMITADELRKLKSEHPDALVLCYVNTTADVKAECDICCTSGNAEKIVRNFIPEDKKTIFVPDKYLADYIAKKTNRKFIYWDGYCPTHRKIISEDILKQKKLHPDAEVIVHPECTPDAIEHSDKALSTEGMCNYIKGSSQKEFIIGTEIGMLYRLQKENPDKIFYPVSEFADCPNMKKNTLEKVLWSLEEMKDEIIIPDDIIQKAQTCLHKMMLYSK